MRRRRRTAGKITWLVGLFFGYLAVSRVGALEVPGSDPVSPRSPGRGNGNTVGTQTGPNEVASGPAPQKETGSGQGDIPARPQPETDSASNTGSSPSAPPVSPQNPLPAPPLSHPQSEPYSAPPVEHIGSLPQSQPDQAPGSHDGFPTYWYDPSHVPIVPGMNPYDPLTGQKPVSRTRRGKSPLPHGGNDALHKHKTDAPLPHPNEIGKDKDKEQQTSTGPQDAVDLNVTSRQNDQNQSDGKPLEQSGGLSPMAIAAIVLSSMMAIAGIGYFVHKRRAESGSPSGHYSSTYEQGRKESFSHERIKRELAGSKRKSNGRKNSTGSSINVTRVNSLNGIATPESVYIPPMPMHAELQSPTGYIMDQSLESAMVPMDQRYPQQMLPTQLSVVNDEQMIMENNYLTYNPYSSPTMFNPTTSPHTRQAFAFPVSYQMHPQGAVSGMSPRSIPVVFQQQQQAYYQNPNHVPVSHPSDMQQRRGSTAQSNSY